MRQEHQGGEGVTYHHPLPRKDRTSPMSTEETDRMIRDHQIEKERKRPDVNGTLEELRTPEKEGKATFKGKETQFPMENQPNSSMISKPG